MKDKRPEDVILDAALEVVKEKTISGTRMHLIAERAGMVQSNLHYYYKTKNDLMLALHQKVLNKCLEIRQELKETAEDTLENQIEIFIQQKIEFIIHMKEYDYAELDFWVQGRINLQMREAFAASFENWRKEIGEMLDHYVSDLDIEKRTYLPHVIVSLLEGATIQFLIEEDSFDVLQYFDFCKTMILNVIQSSFIHI